MATKEKTKAPAPPAASSDPQTPPAESKKAAKKRTVELRDKDTGFFDQATGFQVVRDQRVELGSSIGDATQVALASGRLLIVED